jgi:hypothetical protein
LWNGVKKVTSVIVSTTVSTVVNVFGSGIMGTGTDNGVIDNLLCTIPGVFYGLYYGVVIGIDCDPFDFDCMLSSEEYQMACNG